MRGSQEQGKKGKGQEGRRKGAGRKGRSTPCQGKGERGGEEQGWGEGKWERREHNTDDKIRGRAGDRRQTAKMEELEIASSDVKGCGAMGGDRDRGMVGRRERGRK